MWNIIEGFDTLITEYQYNSQDQITMYSHYGSGSPRTFRNSFDYAGRLSKVEFYAGAPDAPNPEYITLAEYSYNENSQVSQQKLNNGSVKNNFFILTATGFLLCRTLKEYLNLLTAISRMAT